LRTKGTRNQNRLLKSTDGNAFIAACAETHYHMHKGAFKIFWSTISPLSIHRRRQYITRDVARDSPHDLSIATYFSIFSIYFN